MDLDGVADELYGLPPEQFTAARTAREKEARSAGDRALAAAIHRLGKPTTAAWLANQLVREHRDQIGPLLELGALLRAASATLSGDQLRLLDRQQHQVIQALVTQAGRAAAAAGRRVSDEMTRGLEDTLHAALADESAAAQFSRGRLTEVLRRTGFPATNATAAAATEATEEAEEAATVPDELAIRRRAAELERAARAEIARAEREEREAWQAVAAARQVAEEAARTRDTLAGAAEAAGAELAAAAATEDRLRHELATAANEHLRLRGRQEEIARDLEKAGAAARDAADLQAAATARHRELAEAHRREAGS